MVVIFFSSRRRHTTLQGDWSSDVCSSDLLEPGWVLTTGVDAPVRDGDGVDGESASRAPERRAGGRVERVKPPVAADDVDRKSIRLNSSHLVISYAVFCLKKKKKQNK